MGAKLAVLMLLVLGAAAYMWSLQRSQPTAPPSGSAPSSIEDTISPPAPAQTASGERSGVATAPPAQPAPSPTAPEPGDAALASEPVAAAITLVVKVKDRVTGEPIQPFRWRFLSPGPLLRGESDQSTAELSLPGGVTGELLIEADGMQPFSQSAITIPAPPAPATPLDVFLTPTAMATGITLLVKDVAQQPVQHVRVDAFPITDENRETAWQLDRTLWARHTSSPDGRYTLPPLPPGEFGIRLVATDEAGELLPLLPYRRTFVLTGSNGYVEDVPLEPGCVPRIELLEPNGQPFDLAGQGRVTLGLHLIGQSVQQRMWVAKAGDRDDPTSKATVTAIDAAPATGIVWPAEPMPAGTYTLEIFVNGDPRLKRPLTLLSGERQLERIIVP